MTPSGRIITIFLVLFLAFLVFVGFIITRKKSVLIASFFSPEDASQVEGFLSSLRDLLLSSEVSADLLVLTHAENTDVIETFQRKGEQPGAEKVNLALLNYDTEPLSSTLAKVRQLALNTAQSHGYQYVFFLDSNVRIREETLTSLMSSAADITYVPLVPDWHSERVVAVNSDRGIVLAEVADLEKDTTEKYLDIACGGLDCTLVSQSAFDVPVGETKQTVAKPDELAAYTITGENVGFYQNALLMGKEVKAVLRHHITKVSKASSVEEAVEKT